MIAEQRLAVQHLRRPCSRTARMSGVISTSWPSASWRCFQTRPSGPGQRSQTLSSRAVPRRSALQRDRRGAAVRRRSRLGARGRTAPRPGRSTPSANSTPRAAPARRSGRGRVDREALADADRARRPRSDTSALRGAAPASASTSAAARAGRRAGPARRSSRPARAAPISSASGATAAAARIGAAGRVDQRGASICSISRAITLFDRPALDLGGGGEEDAVAQHRPAPAP